MRRLLSRIAGSYRVRLVVAFSGVVAVALALVLATLPRLLDGYFADQEREDLQTRARVVGVFVLDRLVQFQAPPGQQARPILLPTAPRMQAGPAVIQALGTAQEGYVKRLADVLARANVTVRIREGGEPEDPVAFEMTSDFDPRGAAPGQQQEDITAEAPLLISDFFFSQTGAAAPVRRVTVELSQPWTFRAQTLSTIVGVMFAAAGLALMVAVVASILLAQRLTDPIRRLTHASRALAEGQLGSRVPVTGSGSPEVGELAAAFNVMAERLQQSIEFTRRDRDRGRDFLADVSHELRTPIAALRTFNELLQDGVVEDPATRQEFLEQSGQQIERLDWLATNLLELSKLDSGLVALELRPDDLRAVVESAVQQAEPGAQRKGVGLHLDLPSEPVRQRHDPQRLGQVLANLIGNAVKFTPAGGRVDVILRPTPDGAELRVADTGVGIDPDELPRVFERFYRGSRAHEVRAAGSGLGLSIVRSIVEMHHGRVSIQSSLGRGTEVAVSLPRDVTLSSPAAAPS